MVSAAAENNLISGYPDGTFQPQKSITRGEAAVILLNAVGTPVSRPGTTTLGDVWGNVTITSSGVTLKDTVVAGNLYVTAGVELGDVVLENVKVLGEIVVSGGGVSEAGEDSVILRNVDAPKLVVDNIKNQQVSLRVEGDGLIQHGQRPDRRLFGGQYPSRTRHRGDRAQRRKRPGAEAGRQHQECGQPHTGVCTEHL